MSLVGEKEAAVPELPASDGGLAALSSVTFALLTASSRRLSLIGSGSGSDQNQRLDFNLHSNQHLVYNPYN